MKILNRDICCGEIIEHLKLTGDQQVPTPLLKLTWRTHKLSGKIDKVYLFVHLTTIF